MAPIRGRSKWSKERKEQESNGWKRLVIEMHKNSNFSSFWQSVEIFLGCELCLLSWKEGVEGLEASLWRSRGVVEGLVAPLWRRGVGGPLPPPPKPTEITNMFIYDYYLSSYELYLHSTHALLTFLHCTYIFARSLKNILQGVHKKWCFFPIHCIPSPSCKEELFWS